jgi:AraC family ethanolamine operon transcriptional activator
MTTVPDSTSHRAARPVTRVISRKLRNFSEFSEAFAQWNGQFQQISRGQFLGSIQVVAGQNVRVFAATTNQSILTRGMDSDFATFIPITTRNEATSWHGRSLNAGQLIVKRPEAEYHNLTSRNTTIRALLVPVRLLEDAACILGGSKTDFQFPTWSAVRLATTAMTSVDTGLSKLIAVALQDPTFLESREGKALEMEVLHRVINAVAPSQMAEEKSLAPSSRVALVRRAVDLIHANLDRPLTALDLCAELDTSDRTLRRAFRQTYGLGPLAYFRVMRLNAVRLALQGAPGSHDSVADIALRWGFHRLGSFANEYRVQFGELPSHTLGVRGTKTSRHGK